MVERTKIKDYEDYRIGNVAVRFMKKGVLEKAEPFGCVGSLKCEPETQETKKTCGGRTLKQVITTTSIKMTLEAHVKPEIAIEVLGLTPDGLKKGVYGYNGMVTPKGNIVCTIYDMYGEVEKLIAVPNVTFDGGLNLNIESGQDEVAMLEIPMTALIDDNGFFYYQAFVEDLADPELAKKWKQEFASDLVAETPGVIGA